MKKKKQNSIILSIMSKENENNSQRSKSSKRTSKDSNQSKAVDRKSSVIGDKQPKQHNEDQNLDNASFCSDDTIELLSDANSFLFEDEDIAENEKILLSEPRYHKSLRVVSRINLSRISDINTAINIVADKNNTNLDKPVTGLFFKKIKSD